MIAACLMRHSRFAAVVTHEESVPSDSSLDRDRSVARTDILWTLLTAFVLWVMPAPSAASAPVIYEATGATPADIVPTIEQFKRDSSYGGRDNGDLPGGLPNGWRELTWDSPHIEESGSIAFPTRGVYLEGSILGSNLQISDSSGSNHLFGDIDPSYPNTFRPFGSERVLGTTITDFSPRFAVYFQPEWVRSFGAVFSDVDKDFSATFFFYVRGPGAGAGAYTLAVPSSPGNGNLSFLGVTFLGAAPAWLWWCWTKLQDSHIGPGRNKTCRFGRGRLSHHKARSVRAYRHDRIL